MDPECKVMGFQFEPERSISSLREIRLSGKIATLMFGENVEIAPQ